MDSLRRIKEFLSLFSKIGDLYINKSLGSAEEKYHWHDSVAFDVWQTLSLLRTYLLTFSKTEPTFAVMRSNGTVWSPMFNSRTTSASCSTLCEHTRQTSESFHFLSCALFAPVQPWDTCVHSETSRVVENTRKFSGMAIFTDFQMGVGWPWWNIFILAYKLRDMDA